MTACPFCGAGKWRLWLERRLCWLIGHDWTTHRRTKHYQPLDECKRCFMIKTEVWEHDEKEFLKTIMEPHEIWRRQQTIKYVRRTQ